jgi:hypothetical protein|tara:strand:+ start:39 stop:1520 length:1482 start_codon:yes stop_codon:yes gene_type:complete
VEDKMARFSEHDPTPIYTAVDKWRDNCLLQDASVLSSENIWTTKNLAELDKSFVQNPLLGEQSFYEKLKIQLEETSGSVKRLAAEMLWVMFLFPSKITTQKKLDGIMQVWTWSGTDLNISHPMLSGPLEHGIGSCGQAYNNLRGAELAFFIEIVQKWKGLSSEKENQLLGNPWEFGGWLDELEDSKKRQLRHILVHLLFPDNYERISSKTHKNMIVHAFADDLRDKNEGNIFNATDSDWLKIDKQLYLIRQKYSELNPGQDIDFYRSPLKERWYVNYWVEKTIVSGRPDRESGEHALGKALWSPQRSESGSSIYANMNKVKPDDVVLHLIDNHCVSGVSLVAKRVDDSFIGLEGTEWADRTAYRVPLQDYIKLEPVLERQEFLEDANSKLILESIAENHRDLFYNRDFQLRQGAYLTKAPVELVEVLDDIYHRKSGNHLPHVGELQIPDQFNDKEPINEILELFHVKKNIILYGPPGTGKTYFTKIISVDLLK